MLTYRFEGKLEKTKKQNNIRIERFTFQEFNFDTLETPFLPSDSSGGKCGKVLYGVLLRACKHPHTQSSESWRVNEEVGEGTVASFVGIGHISCASVLSALVQAAAVFVVVTEPSGTKDRQETNLCGSPTRLSEDSTSCTFASTHSSRHSSSTAAIAAAPSSRG